MAEPINIPALRGVMGDWVYYVTLLPFEEVENRIKRTDEVHTSPLLNKWIQRALTERSDTISEYLQSHSQRFFNSLVVGVYEGDPEWHELSLKRSPLFDTEELDERVKESLGFLRLSGEEKLFAIDGQHRVEGIKTFLKQRRKRNLRTVEDEICAIFVAHRNTHAGMQRTRRLFSTLNRTAKPVSLTELIALDEDDIVAIACRSLLEDHPLFRDGRVSIALQKSIGRSDKHSIISLVSLHQTMNLYLAHKSGRQWDEFKALRPPQNVVNEFIRKAHAFWDRLLEFIPELQAVTQLNSQDNLPDRYRNDTNGGDLLFRPIFPPMIARCLRTATKQGIEEKTFVQKLAQVPRELGLPPWTRLLWDGTMITRSKNQKIAEELILWMVGAKIEGTAIRQKLAVLLNEHPKDVNLPAQVILP